MKRKTPSSNTSATDDSPEPESRPGERVARRRHGWMVIVPLMVIAIVAFWISQSHRGNKSSSKTSPASFALENETTVFARYGGAASCRDCHKKEFESWTASNHGLAERALIPSMDEVAFKPSREITHGSQKSVVRQNEGRSEMTTLGFGGKSESYVVDRVIGNDPLRQFLVAAPGGRFQTLELSWDPKKQEWFDVYGEEDRKPGEWGHWTGRGMTWNTMCASCHNTRLRKNYDAIKDTFHTTMAERTVSCEACHGPMKDHNDWQNRNRNRGGKNDPTIKKLTRDQVTETCGSCHARRAELTGDFKPGDSFFDHYALSIVDDTDIFHPDGQVRDEDYEFTSFLSSKMHAAGVRCADCHDPHSAKTIATGDALCMRCHATPTPQFPKAPVIVPAAHTFHKPESTGSQCINCHMPQTTYMQRHPRHDHGFTVPDPRLTRHFGIPNACNRCHADKDANWAQGFVTQWYGEKMNRPSRLRTTTMSQARQGETASRDSLIAWLKGDDSPSWKASSCLLLGRWAAEPAVTEALQEQLRHESPLVRSAAVHALNAVSDGGNHPARDALRPLLKDPSRSVRLAAAWALCDDVSPDSPAGKELNHMLAINADQPSGRMQLGLYEFKRGNHDAAIAQLRQAIAWDPNSPPFHHDLAIMLSTTGRTKEAIAELEAAIKLDPKQAVYHYELGLAWSEAGDLDKTVAALEQTVKLDPSMHRAWYNLGLARNAKGNTDGAIEALKRGEVANPRDAALPYARATILLNLGRKEEALAAAQAALIAQPGFPQALQLVQMLSQNRGAP